MVYKGFNPFGSEIDLMGCTVARTFDPTRRHDLTPFYRAKPVTSLVTQLFQKEGPTCAELNSSSAFICRPIQLPALNDKRRPKQSSSRSHMQKALFVWTSTGHRTELPLSYTCRKENKKVVPLPLLQGGNVSLSRSSMDSGLRGVQPLSNRWWLGGHWLFSQPQMPIV